MDVPPNFSFFSGAINLWPIATEWCTRRDPTKPPPVVTVLLLGSPLFRKVAFLKVCLITRSESYYTVGHLASSVTATSSVIPLIRTSSRHLLRAQPRATKGKFSFFVETDTSICLPYTTVLE